MIFSGYLLFRSIIILDYLMFVAFILNNQVYRSLISHFKVLCTQPRGIQKSSVDFTKKYKIICLNYNLYLLYRRITIMYVVCT